MLIDTDLINRVADSADLSKIAWEPKVVTPPPAAAPQSVPRRRLTLRQLLFRCARLILAGILIYGAGVYFWDSFTQVNSERAVVAADIISLQTPIEGQVRIADLNPGTEFAAGSLAFRVVNPRFGNKQSSSQLNWARENVEHLQAETKDAAVRLAKQEEIFQYHQRLYDNKVSSRVEYLEQQSKVAVARAALENLQTQLGMAKARAQEIANQVELQKEATVNMPFAGMVWAVGTRDGAPVSAHETVLQIFDPKRVWVEAVIHEKHADKFLVGTPVYIRTVDGKTVWQGTIDTIRGQGSQSVGDKGLGMVTAGMPAGRMAVKVRMNKVNPFTYREFYGVGRSVIVSLDKP